MSEITNPYRPGKPVTDPAMLYGRQDVADWIDLQISANNQTLVLSALPLVGKTSFLQHLGVLQTAETINLMVSMPGLSLDAAEISARRTRVNNQLTLDTVVQLVVDQLLPQLNRHKLVDTLQSPTTAQTATMLRQLMGQVNKHLAPEQRLLILMDDLHLLINDDMSLIASFLTSLMPLLDECPTLHLVFAINQDKLKLIRHPLLDGAPIFNLGTLAADASINMVTQPVKGILRFDYGVTKRISEVCSHHPYYLSLYCHTLLNRQVHDGWVNQQDFDNALTEILESPIKSFTQIWDESNWAERAVLAGMCAIQGAHGPITNQEIMRFLQRQHAAVQQDVVLHALQTLSERGVLIQMGAVSYRFHVEMLRFWLREHTDPAEIIPQVNWNRAAAELKPAVKEPRLTARSTPRQATTARSDNKNQGKWLALGFVLLLMLCALPLFGGIMAAQIFNIPVTLFNTPTNQPTPQTQATAAAFEPPPPEETPTPEAPPEPTAVPTPTPPIVVARTLPSITYMGRDIDENWRIYVMEADGSNPTQISTIEDGDDTAPVWSPDGQKIAFVSRRDGNREIYIMDGDGQNEVNVTRHPADDWTPAWSPDSSRLAFSSFRDGSWEIFVLDSACISEPSSCPENITQLTNDGSGNLSPVWSPDSTRFAFNNKVNDNWDIFTMAVDGADVRQITDDPANDLAPAWSPDGSQLAFESNREGNVEIYISNANGGAIRNITNLPLADDHGPTWSPDGQQIVFYSNREGNWDIFAASTDGNSVVNLTNTAARDEQTPAWRP